MRVLLDCRMADWSGVGRYTTGLARALVAGGEVELVQIRAAGERSPVEADGGLEVLTARRHPFGVAGAMELARLIERARPDLVHCPHFPTPVPARRPLVVTLHDLIPLEVSGVMPSTLRRAAYRRWNSRATRAARRLVVPSGATAADVVRRFPGVRGKLAVVAEAADDFASGPVGPLPAPLCEAASAPYLLAMADARPHKGLRTLLAAFARVAATSSGVRLLLVGTGTSAVAALLEEIPPEARELVTLAGHVSDGELRALYAGARLFVFPSCYEGFGLPPLEAMALGAPVVCAAAASLPEVVGDAAAMFPAGDVAALAAKLTDLVGDSHARRELARAGGERAARFTWRRAAGETVAVYREALASRAPREA